MARQRKFAFQGTYGAFSHRAGQIFAQALEQETPASDKSNPAAPDQRSAFIPCQTFEALFASILNGDADFGVVPLENSSIGSITANYDLLWTSTAYIVAEIYIPVHHNLMTIAGAKLNEIREVYSHPAALGQCQNLFKTFTQMQACNFWDTSGAAQFVNEQKRYDIAAIAGHLAASEYGLEILKENIEDHKGNSTRFGIIVALGSLPADSQSPPIPQQLPYKMTVAVELEHKPGSLAALIGQLAKLEVNLTKIESRPIPETPWHYRFFLDMVVADREVDEKALQVLLLHSADSKILGRYTAAQQG